MQTKLSNRRVDLQNDERTYLFKQKIHQFTSKTTLKKIELKYINIK